MQKRNFETKKYQKHTTPEDWDCPLYCQDMTHIVNCANCWDKLLYWQTFTSKSIHNQYWLWYGICEVCYDKEIKEEQKHWKL